MSQSQQFSTNLHPSFFQQDLPLEPQRRTSASVENERSNPIGDLVQPMKGYTLFQSDNDKNPNYTYGRTILKHVWNDSLLMDAYFSRANLNLIRKQLKYTVWKASGERHLIDPNSQSETELLAILSAIFLQYSNNMDTCNPTAIREQIRELNDRVITEITPRLLTEVEQYIGYLHDASNNPVPIHRPRNVSAAGTKLLRSQTDIMFGDNNFFNNNLNQPGLFDNQQPGFTQMGQL